MYKAYIMPRNRQGLRKKLITIDEENLNAAEETLKEKLVEDYGRRAPRLLNKVYFAF